MPETSVVLCPSCSAELPPAAAFCMRCGSATPTSLTGGALAYRPPSQSRDVERRQLLQRLLGAGYELRALIGRGGFADVFEAYDSRLKRALAVKTLRDDLETSEALLERFRREAEAIAQLRHPNVIPIYAVGGEGDVAYFVMPKIDGESLATRLVREPKLPVSESVRILREAAGALGAAHQEQMVHRDVKPENIMLDGPKRRVLVMDFGIAKSVGPSEKGLTGTGILIGTPHYMSPEQATGERTIDHRSDQYSLAIVGYRMLSGQLPFDGDNMQTVIYKQLGGAFTPLAELAPDVPLGVANVIERALSKDPAQRFESMDAFIEALDKASGGAVTSGSRRMRAEDLGTRIAAMKAALPGWRSPITIGAVVLAGVGTWIGIDTPHVAAELAANRDEGVFAARTFLASLGQTGQFKEATSFEGPSDNRFTFLTRTLDAAAIDRRGRTDVPLWKWRVRLTEARPSGEPLKYAVSVGPAGNIFGYRKVISDSARAPQASRDSIEQAALQELRARGIDVSTLRAIDDSTITLKNRSDLVLRWVFPTDGIPWNGDSAFPAVSVRMMGATPTEVLRTFRLPGNYVPADENALAFSIVAIVMIGGAVLGIWLLATQMKRDELQWDTALRLAIAATLLGLPLALSSGAFQTDFSRGFAEGSGATSAPPRAMELAILIFGKLFFAGLIALLAVITESLGAEHRRRMFAAIPELMRGRFSTPEFVTGVATGSLAGVAVLFAVGLTDYLTLRITGTYMHSSISPLVSASVPAFALLSAWADMLTLAMCAGLFSLAIYRFRASEKLALIIPILMIVLIQLVPSSSSTTIGERIHTALYAAAIPVIVWRYGVLAGTMAMSLMAALPALLLRFQYSNASPLPTVLVAVIVAVPFVLAFVAYRRLASGASTGTFRTIA